MGALIHLILESSEPRVCVIRKAVGHEPARRWMESIAETAMHDLRDLRVITHHVVKCALLIALSL